MIRVVASEHVQEKYLLTAYMEQLYLLTVCIVTYGIM